MHHFKSIGEFKLEWLEMLNSDKNCRVFVLHDLEIWWMTLKNNRAPLLYYIKLCAAFQSQWHIQTGVTVRKRSIRVKIGDFFFVPGDCENWRMTLKNNRAPLLCYVKLCASVQIHWGSQTRVTAWKRSSRVKIGDFFFVPRDLGNWYMTLKNNRAPLLCCFNLYASFHSQWCIQIGVTVRKRPIWVKLDDFLAVWPWNLTDDLEEQ